MATGQSSTTFTDPKEKQEEEEEWNGGRYPTRN